jgi:hypothetical protein
MTTLSRELLQLLENEAGDIALLEDKGNLSEIPDAWMKIVSKGHAAVGGRGSDIKSIAASIKNVSKFRTSIIDAMKADDLAAVYLTVNDGPFALIYKKSSFSSSRPEYSIVAVDGSKEKIQKSTIRRELRVVRSEYSKKGYYKTFDRKTHWYEQESMPMSTLLPKLQGSMAEVVLEEDEDKAKAFDNIFKTAKIDLYGITVDANRQALRKERSANKPFSTNSDSRESIQADLNAADKRYLKSKAGEVGKKLQDEVTESLDKIKDRITSIFDDAADGKRVSRTAFDTELKELQDKIKTISQLAYAVESCVKSNGNAEMVDRWRSLKKSYSFEYLIKTLKLAKGESAE